MDSKQLTPTHSIALSDMLLHGDGSPTTVTVSFAGPVPQEEDPAALSLDTAREALRQALYRNQEPVLMPLEYLKQFCQDKDLESNPNEIVTVKDTVLGQTFKVVPIIATTTATTTTATTNHVHHSNLQRIYGYCNDPSYLVLEDLPKGVISSFLKNNKGRVQLNAQRRIQIMLDVAKVLSFLHEKGCNYSVSSHNIGLTLDLNPKLMRKPSKTSTNAIYDFGILMMELLTGTLQNNQSDDYHYGDFVERYSHENGPIIEDDLDAYVRESWTFNILSQLIELAKSCVADGEEQPSHSKLVDRLTLISARMQVVENYDWYM